MKDHNIRQIVSQISKTIILLNKEIITLKKDKKHLINRLNDMENKMKKIKLDKIKEYKSTHNQINDISSNEINLGNKLKIVLNSNKVDERTLEKIIFELKKIDECGNIFTITKLETNNDGDDFFYNFYLGDTLINGTDKLFTMEKYK